MLKCKLCGEEKPLLKKSHIFPEFLYKVSISVKLYNTFRSKVYN
jgi:hypothetical protein